MVRGRSTRRYPPTGPRDRPVGTGTAGTSGCPNRPPERAPDDVHDLLHVFVGLAPLGGGADAALDVVLEDEDRERVDGGPEGGRLLEDVDAVLLPLDHPGDPADLAFHPRQAAGELSPVLRIRMAEVGRR